MNTLKVVFVGDTQVGKSCVIERFVNRKFKLNPTATIGAAFQTQILETPNGSVKLQIWDTAGQEKYRSLAPMYFRSADVAILCYDTTNMESFESLDSWTSDLAQKAPVQMKLLMVGNKIDLEDERVIPIEKAKLYAEQHNAIYMETSAKTGDGIDEMFRYIAENCVEQNKIREFREQIPEKPISNQTTKEGCC
ncbi:small GTP-binding protein [Histomonas meleagridis]|uniref:small GTP-binding protein n=1 Tax=Histomonas meleagridis TaxID=135588 RepID=UPI003559FD50|nr:small GTP-binding protein [Histomonas meleagridis]KAH0799785.1 small GTP-binding protein [Histomonas meleagridis]